MTAFREHVASTLELFAAVVRHGNESDEAEAVRDGMDDTWRELDESRVTAVRWLTATLNEFLSGQKLDER